MFKIKVPAAQNNNNIILVKLGITLRPKSPPTAADGVAYTIQDPQSISKRFPTGSAFNPAAALGGQQNFPAPASPPGLSPDGAYVVPPTATSPTGPDPNARRYKAVIDLLSDYVFNAGGGIDSTITTDEEFTIDMLSQGGGNTLGSACVQSFAFITNFNTPDRLLVPAHGAFIENMNDPAMPACAETRPGLDVILVLDHSGSMGSQTTGAVSRQKIEALRQAVQVFVQTWGELRTYEAIPAPAGEPPLPPVPTDKIGVVIFDHNAAWWSTLPATGLVNFTTAAPLFTPTNLNTIAPAGATSIGAGLLLADAAFATADPNRRRAVLVMSNGMQNTTPLVGVTTTTPKHVFTYPSGSTSGPNLPNQDKYQIYSVTVGTGLAVSAQINEDIASATRGFYTNTETDAETLRTFFVELLQNFVRFNSWETALLASGSLAVGDPFETTFRSTSTTTDVAVIASWPAEFGRLRVTVLPPGTASVTEVGSGSAHIGINLASLVELDYLGEWRVQVDVPASDDTHGTSDGVAGAVFPRIPVQVAVVVDDRAVSADLDIETSEVIVGSPIQLRAGMTELGRPVLGLGTRPGETVVAQVLKPGQSVGDLLASSKASAQPGQSPDPQTAAEAKLFNELQANPDALKQQEDLIQLTDPDGDGVYTGTYPTKEPGHYTFLFGVQGRTNEAGFVSRQQIKSVWVRPVPDASATTISIATTTIPSGNRLSINFTPKTKFGNLMGPGWANYFWLTAGSRPAFKAVDNLNGSYTATLDYTGNVPGVSLHFLGVSILITDDVPPDRLPVPLDDRTVVVPQIPGTGDQKSGCLLILVTLIQRIIRIFRP